MASAACAVGSPLWLGRFSLLTAVLAGVGRAAAEVGAIGEQLLALYRAMENHAAAGVMADMERLRALMVEGPPED